MAQGKKATAGSKGAVKKVADRVKSAVGAAKKKLVPKKAAAPAKAAPKPSPKKVAKPAPKKAAAKPAPKPAPKAAAKKPAPKPAPKAAKPAPKAAPKKVVKAPAKAAAKAVTKAAPKAAAKVKAAATAVKTAVAKAAKAAPKPAPKPAKAPARIETAKPAKALPKAVPDKAPEKKVAPSTPAVPVAPPAPPAAAAPKPAAAVDDKAKRGRRARPRVTSSGAPAASWLTSEKPRAASFIPAPPRAEAPSAIAAPPASSDRLLRPEDVVDMAVRTVPVRVDVEQGAGRFYVHANPLEVFLRVGEGIEWDFRYLGGADVSCEEVVVEFEKPSPFMQTVFRTRKPGGARPHRQISGPALPGSVGQHVAYMIRANTGFKTELANAKVWLTVTA